jgi:hypothetical protein
MMCISEKGIYDTEQIYGTRVEFLRRSGRSVADSRKKY